MRKFFSKLFIFLLPIALLLALPFSVLILSGELSAPGQVISWQTSGKKVLYGPAYSGYIKSLKAEAAAKLKPDVLALGNSRILQIRQEYFNPGVKFYNAGLTIVRIPDFRKFLSHVPLGSQPKLLLIDLDQSWFNQQTYELATNQADEFAQPKVLDSALNVFVASWLKVYQDYFNRKYSLSQIASAPPANERLIGLNAIVNSNGFRNDGSYYNGQFLKDPQNPQNPDYQFSQTKADIQQGIGSFAFGSSFSQDAATELAAFLDECKQRGIYVAAFLPPFPHQIWQSMIQSQNFGYLSGLSGHLSPLFSSRGFEFYDFSDMAALGAPDKAAVDGQHVAEKPYVSMFVDMLKQGSRLSQYSDQKALSVELKSAANDYYVFPDHY